MGEKKNKEQSLEPPKDSEDKISSKEKTIPTEKPVSGSKKMKKKGVKNPESLEIGNQEAGPEPKSTSMKKGKKVASKSNSLVDPPIEVKSSKKLGKTTESDNTQIVEKAPDKNVNKEEASKNKKL